MRINNIREGNERKIRVYIITADIRTIIKKVRQASWPTLNQYSQWLKTIQNSLFCNWNFS